MVGPKLAALLLAMAQYCSASPLPDSQAIILPKHVDDKVRGPWESFLSYSIEFSWFTEFAGNASHPNSFTQNLIDNIGKLQGTRPHIRVGGNTQDKTTFFSDQQVGMIGTFEDDVSGDYHATVSIGPAYFESYHNFPNTTFVHGFNMASGSNSTEGLQNILEHARVACKEIGQQSYAWEYGNEADMFPIHEYRTWEYSEQDVFNEWSIAVDAIHGAVAEACPELEPLKYFAPSFAQSRRWLNSVDVWKAGFDKRDDVKAYVHHTYMGAATDPGLTLQGTLLNHTHTALILANHTRIMGDIGEEAASRYILGETNSLARQGLPLVSDAFGAALWNVDYSLHAASIGIRRVHMHQGVNYRYASWQPIETERAVKTTKPAYYANVATAEIVGDVSRGDVKVIQLDLGSDADENVDVGYGIYVDGEIEKVTLLNLRSWNISATSERPAKKYEIVAPKAAKSAELKRLTADGTDAQSGISYGGYSYNLELDNGKPVRLDNVTDVEEVRVGRHGKLVLEVPSGSAAVLKMV